MLGLTDNKHWRALKRSIVWGSRRTFLEAATVMFVFPIVEAYLVNVWTGSAADEASVARSILIGVALLHIVLGSLVLAGERQSDARRCRCRRDGGGSRGGARELDRRAKAYRMIVAAVDEFNRRTCAIDPWCNDGFEGGLKPVIARFTKDIGVTLGVTSNQYTIEVHLNSESVDRRCGMTVPCVGFAGLCLEFYYSPQVSQTRRGPSSMVRLQTSDRHAGRPLSTTLRTSQRFSSMVMFRGQRYIFADMRPFRSRGPARISSSGS